MGLNYKGTLLDGTVFDENDSTKFIANRVIRGWTEGLGLLGEGGKATLYIPANLAYGERGNRNIEPNSVLVFDVEVLCQLAQLEVANKDVAIASLESVAKFLDSVSIDECASCFAFSVDSIGDSAGVLCAFKANSVNVAIGFAAAILCRKTIFSQGALNAIEAILHARVNSIEAITDAIGNTTKLSIYILIVKALEQVGASYCILQLCGTITSE